MSTLPGFKVKPYTKLERAWLGLSVRFSRADGCRIRNGHVLPKGIATHDRDRNPGHVVGLSGLVAGHLSVYVPGEGWWAVHPSNLQRIGGNTVAEQIQLNKEVS